MLRLALLTMLCASQAVAWSEPARGSADRAALMDAIRPHAEWQLGRPVEFVVNGLRVQGNRAFAMLQPQRPGGEPIDASTTPMMLRDAGMADFMDGVHLEALYQKSGATWVAVHWAIGATDVWYADPALCADYASVIPDVC